MTAPCSRPPLSCSSLCHSHVGSCSPRPELLSDKTCVYHQTPTLPSPLPDKAWRCSAATHRHGARVFHEQLRVSYDELSILRGGPADLLAPWRPSFSLLRQGRLGAMGLWHLSPGEPGICILSTFLTRVGGRPSSDPLPP